MSENKHDKLLDAVKQLDATLRAHLTEVIKPQEEDGDASISSLEKVYALQKEPRRGVTIYIRTVFLRIGEIDTIKENFSANVFIQAKWREPSLDNYPPDAVNNIDWTKMWSPKLYIENLEGDPRQIIWHTVTFDDQGQATAYEKRRVKGSFMESMELNQFPFDTQDLTVSVASELVEDDIYLEEDQSEVSTINTQSFIDEQEWALHTHVEVKRRTRTSHYNNIRFKPMISSSCCAKRRPGFFVWNILVVMFFICTLAFATFSVSPASPHFRLKLSFTLLLTTIAFKFTANQSLPKISYLTLLDKYILTSIGILCSICVWHAIIPIIMVSQPSGRDNTTLSQVTKISFDVSSIHPDDLQVTLDLDRYAVIALICVHVFFHIVFFTIIIVQSHIKKYQYAKKEEQHEVKLEATQKLTMESEEKEGAENITTMVVPLTEALDHSLHT